VRLVLRLVGSGVRHRTKLGFGASWEAICRQFLCENYDLVIVGTRDLSRAGGILFGSTGMRPRGVRAGLPKCRTLFGIDASKVASDSSGRAHASFTGVCGPNDRDRYEGAPNAVLAITCADLHLPVCLLQARSAGA